MSSQADGAGLTAGQRPHLSAAVSKASDSRQQPSSVTTSPLRSRVSSQQPQPAVDDGRRTIAKVPPSDSDDEDEVEIIQAFCGRPTRSGRIPRPAVRPEEATVEEDVDRVAPVKSSAPDNSTNIQTRVAETALRTLSKPVVSLSQSRHVTSSTKPSAPIHSTSPALAAVSSTASAVAMPPLDINHLPPGYFVVVEMPSSGVNSGHQQALYHIFAVDQDSKASSALPPTSAISQPLYSAAGSAANQQRVTLSSGNAVHQSAVYSQPTSVSNAGTVRNGNMVQLARQTSLVYSQSGHRAATTTATTPVIPWHTGRHVVADDQSSSGQDSTQICEDLSGYELIATTQADGTVVIQTMPTARCIAQPPADMVPRPGAAPLVPRLSSMKLVPRLPSTKFNTRQPSMQQVMPRQPRAAEILLDVNSSNLSSDVTGHDDDDAQYVDIVVEDCDDFEREEYVV